MVHCRVRKSLSPVPILSQINPVHTDSYFLGIRFVLETCALLSCYAASSGNSLAIFRYNLPVPSSRDKNPTRFPLGFLTLEDEDRYFTPQRR